MRPMLLSFTGIALLYGASTSLPVLLNTILFLSYLLVTAAGNRPLINSTLFLVFAKMIGIFSIIMLVDSFFVTTQDWTYKYAIYGLTVVPLIMLSGSRLGLVYSAFDENEKIAFALGIIFFSFLVVLAYMTGIIHIARYQHVGNVAGIATIISLVYMRSSKRLFGICFLFFATAVLIIGSRQALLGLLISGFIVLYRLLKSTVLKGILFLTITMSIYYWNELMRIVFTLGSNYNMNTLVRIAYTQLYGEESRLRIFKAYFANVKILPSSIDYGIESEYLPHNFFLEYSYVTGALLGLLFCSVVLIMLRVTSRTFNAYTAITWFYFIPFNVSSGWTASRYFIFFICLSLAIHYDKQGTKHSSSSVEL